METVRKTLFSYRRDRGGTRGVAQVQGDHWQFAMGREAAGSGINCLSSVHCSTNLSMEFLIWRAEHVVGADGPSGEAGGQGSQRRRRGRGHKRCHCCQQLGHIARYCRAPEPRPATKKQPSTAPSSAGSALSNAKRWSMGRSQQKGFLSLTDTSSDAAAVSQASFNKPQGQRRLSRQKTVSPRSSDEMPDPEDPEKSCVTVSCRPTNTVPRVVSVKSCLRQSIAASAIRDASEHEPRCLSSGGVRKFDLSPPKFVRHRVCYTYTTGRPVPPEEKSVTTIDEESLHQVHRRPSPCRQPQRADVARWD